MGIAIVYRIIVTMITLAIILCMVKEKDLKSQINAAFVLIPFILRTFMIK